MKTKQLTLSLLALMLFTASLLPVTASAVEAGGDAYTGINSMYLWRGDDLSTGDAVVQSGMDVSVKGLTFSYWSNLSLNSGELDETDITIDYSTDLSELLSVSIGNILYALDGAADTNELYLGLSLKTFLEPTLTVYYDYDGAPGDLFVTAAISHSLELMKGLDLNLGGLVSYIDNDTLSDLHNLELSAGLNYAITDQLALSPSLIYSAPLSDNSNHLAYGDGIDEEFMGALSLTLSF